MFVGTLVPWMGAVAPGTDVWIFTFEPLAHIHLVVPTHVRIWPPICPTLLDFAPFAVVGPILVRAVCVGGPSHVWVVPPFLLFWLVVLGGLAGHRCSRLLWTSHTHGPDALVHNRPGPGVDCHESSELFVIGPPPKSPPFPLSLPNYVLIPPQFYSFSRMGLAEDGSIP